MDPSTQNCASPPQMSLERNGKKKKKEKNNIKSETRFFRSTFWHRVVPPTFHKIRVYAISFRRLGNFSKKFLIPQEYLVSHFRLTFCRIPPELSENMYILLFLIFQKMYTFMKFTLNPARYASAKASRGLPCAVCSYSPRFWTWRIVVSSGNRSKLSETPPKPL